MSTRGKVLTVNPAFCYFLGYSETELLSLRPRQIPHPNELPDLQLLLAEVRAGQRQTFEGEKCFLRKDGATVWGHVTANWLFDAKGTPIHAVCLVQDITQRRQVEEKVNQLAYFDPLTDLPNRTLLKDRLIRDLARAQRQNGRGALLFLDLDRFKGINDSLGHAGGDKLLRTFAHRIKECVGVNDTVARLGGDEFVVILSQVPKPEDAAAVARKILEQLAVPLELDGQTISRTVSIGITLFPEDGEEVSNLLKKCRSGYAPG